ncbi:hypothetical protein EN918_36505, partial [Mesorhizobium sp. M7A.F.Ca.CA.004.05.1.1]
MKTPISIKPGTVAAIFIDLQEEHRQDPRYLVEGFSSILANVQRLQALDIGEDAAEALDQIAGVL